jgi:hypothetical protein
MKYRKLRIAWSVMSGIAFLLLVVLWVRSYTLWDSLKFTVLGAVRLEFFSLNGYFFVSAQRDVSALQEKWEARTYHLRNLYYEGPLAATADEGATLWIKGDKPWSGGFNFRLGDGLDIDTRCIFPVGLIAITIGAPWMRFRFSLRTLLIAMTLVAIALGAIVYSMQ